MWYHVLQLGVDQSNAGDASADGLLYASRPHTQLR